MSSARALLILVTALAQPIVSAPPASGTAHGSPAQSTWPSDSLYRIDVALETADGRQTRFSSALGTRIVTFFYSSCPMACPLTIETLLRLDGELTPRERATVDFLLVSIDPERDTPEVLRQLARERHVPDRRWTLARASSADTRMLAAALGVQYRKLADGNFQHSSVFVLLDVNGRAVARSAALGAPAPEFLKAIRSTVDGTGNRPQDR